MKEFFKVMELEQVLEYVSFFPPVAAEEIPLNACDGRILAADIISDIDLPDFSRSTMDGYAVRGSSTFGASEGNPAYLTVKGTVAMGESPTFAIGPGEAARISTGGMLPEGADSVVMIEHTEAIDDITLEAYRSVAPGQHVVEKGEDIRKDDVILSRGRMLRPQEIGLLAALGRTAVSVYRQPVIGIISTGDEVVPIDKTPGAGQIRDINSYTLASLVRKAGGIPLTFGIVQDDFDSLFATCSRALEKSDMVLISGGSSVGVRDYTIEVLSALPESHILVHGISISPGKPTILAQARQKAFWGLPGHVVSAMVVFATVVQPFVQQIGGRVVTPGSARRFSALLSRNLSSAQGRTDFVRVRLTEEITEENGVLWAHPVLGKSGLINTMVNAEGLIEIGINTEGLDKGAKVQVIPF